MKNGSKQVEWCETCKYFGGAEINGEIKTVCRRYAPRIFHGSGAVWSDQQFPITGPTSWCGEYERDEKSEDAESGDPSEMK